MPHTTAAAVLRSLVTIRRLGNAVSATVRDMVEDLFDEIAAELVKIDPTGPKAERWRRERTAKLNDAVRHLTAEGFREIRRAVTDDLAVIGASESAYIARRLEEVVGRRNLRAVGVDIRPGRIGRGMVRSIIASDPIDGLTMREWFDGQAESTARNVMRQIRLGMVQSEPILSRGDDMDLVRRVRRVMDTTARNAETITRTAVNYVANRAHMATYEANSDVVARVRYVATLEGRTCEVCGSYDGDEWELGSAEIQTPPLHPNCRCVLAPVVDWEGLGIEPPEPGTRASAGGPVPATMDYEEWLRGQPDEFQREVLGPGRYKLFTEERMSLRDMIRTDNTVIPLAELRGAREPEPVRQKRERES